MKTLLTRKKQQRRAEGSWRSRGRARLAAGCRMGSSRAPALLPIEGPARDRQAVQAGADPPARRERAPDTSRSSDSLLFEIGAQLRLRRAGAASVHRPCARSSPPALFTTWFAVRSGRRLAVLHGCCSLLGRRVRVTTRCGSRARITLELPERRGTTAAAHSGGAAQSLCSNCWAVLRPCLPMRFYIGTV